MLLHLAAFTHCWRKRGALVGLGILSLITANGFMFVCSAAGEPPVLSSSTSSDTALPLPRSSEEARGRARLLFEMANGSLQVMHRDFFDDESPRAIPSASLEDVFVELERSYGVRMRWLNAGTDMVNFDHQPQDQFDQQAVQAIKRGELHFDTASDTEYQFAGAIRLASQCLKCHVKDRRSNVDQFAGLTIKMRLQPQSNPSEN